MVSDDLFGLRTAAAVTGMATLIGIYSLADLLLGRRILLLARAVAAGDYVLLHFSRLPAYIDPVSFVVIGVFFLVRGLRRGRDFDRVIAGVTFAFACLVYYSGRVALVLAPAVALWAVTTGSCAWAETRRAALLFVAAGVVTLAPMIVHWAQHTEAAIGRGSDVFVFSADALAHLMQKYAVDSSEAAALRSDARYGGRHRARERRHAALRPRWFDYHGDHVWRAAADVVCGDL